MALHWPVIENGAATAHADVSRNQRQVVDRVDGLGPLGAVIHAHRPGDERRSAFA